MAFKKAKRATTSVAKKIHQRILAKAKAEHMRNIIKKIGKKTAKIVKRKRK